LNELPDDRIELRVEEISQLFHTLDPFPFRERDLDKEVEDYIVDWARELRSDGPLRIVVDVPEAEAKTRRAAVLESAFEHFFSYRAGVLDRDIKDLLRIGWRSLAVGVSILSMCLLASHFAGDFLGASPVAGLVEQSFLILGWVANWRPLEIFLYEWWPLARRRRLYRRLAGATVELRPYPAARARRRYRRRRRASGHQS
jgi:hypothetical protein